MLLAWTPQAWEDYCYWRQADKKKIERINALIRDALRSLSDGLGKPEALRFDLAGCWSRRIDHEHRLVYTVDTAKGLWPLCSVAITPEWLLCLYPVEVLGV